MDGRAISFDAMQDDALAQGDPGDAGMRSGLAREFKPMLPAVFTEDELRYPCLLLSYRPSLLQPGKILEESLRLRLGRGMIIRGGHQSLAFRSTSISSDYTLPPF